MEVDRCAAKRRRKNPDASSTFSDLPTDILCSVFKRLDLLDVLRARAVCSSWNLLGKQFAPNTPWLMLPSRQEIDNRDSPTKGNNNAYSGFLKLGESEACSMRNIPKELRECCCIGSSKGWLIFLGDKAVPFLFHPFRQVKIELPSIYSLIPGLFRLERTAEGRFEAEYVPRSGSGNKTVYDKQELRYFVTGKAILTVEPDCNNENYSVVLLICNYIRSYGKEKGKLAYHKSGDSCWNEVPGSKDHNYEDIICHENNLFALYDNWAAVAIWDCEGDNFTPIATCKPIVSDKLSAEADSLGDLRTLRFYLVESCGDILLVVRFVNEYVDSDGELVEQEAADGICPYRTCLFHVYKLDFCEVYEWVEMETLGHRALFVGGNESVSVSIKSFPNCKANSIYYTDDYWLRMEEDFWESMEENYWYGGHDMGVYNLKEGTMEPIYKYSSEQILPPPCWIIP